MTEQSARPRIGCLGVGWIGRHRMQAVIDSGAAEVVAVCDSWQEAVDEALQAAPGAQACGSLHEMLALGLDGVMIATPSAMHAEQSIAALGAGAAVFCQKPLARDEAETRAVVEAARAADRLLGVDFSYRHVAGMGAIRELIGGGELGQSFAVDLVFHNAYGPDKDWFYDRARSGGGCVIDLGVHLVDLALWTLGWPEVEGVEGLCYAGGRRLPPAPEEVEDYAVATLQLAGGGHVRLVCSWRVSAGCDAVIEASFFGDGGGAALKNVGGSFYDFRAERYHGTQTQVLAEPPDAWGGRAAVAWAEQLGRGGGSFDDEVSQVIEVARVVDRIYGR